MKYALYHASCASNAFFLVRIFCSCSFFAKDHYKLTLSHTHFSLNYFVVAKRSVILKEVTATGEGHLHVSMFASSRPLLTVTILDSMEFLRVTLIWLFTLDSIREKQSSQSIFAVILSYWYDTRSVGISRRVILGCHIKPDPVLPRISSVVHSTTTNTELKTVKSLLCCLAHGELCPCSFAAFPAPAILALSHSHICPDSFCFAAYSAPLKAITRGMLVM